MAKWIIEIEVMESPKLRSLDGQSKNLGVGDFLVKAFWLLGAGRPGLVRSRIQSSEDRWRKPPEAVRIRPPQHMSSDSWTSDR